MDAHRLHLSASPRVGAGPLRDGTALPPPSAWEGRPLWAEIDLDAIEANVAALARRAGQAEFVAMVKANAYGHGAVAVSRAALNAGASRLGVACLDEARQLREAGIDAPILVLAHTPVEQAPAAVALGVTLTVNSTGLAGALSEAAAAAGRRADVHIKVDSGLNRYGRPADEAVELAEAVRQMPGLRVEGLFTHFATADETDKQFMHQQLREFSSAAERLPWINVRHCSNTASLLDEPDISFDMVRCGIGIYGLYPSGEVSRSSVNLSPALALKSRLARIKTLSAGETVSYGRRWTARGGEVLGLVMCGYGDGYPRRLSNISSVRLGDALVPIRGTIAMDMMMVDITSGAAGATEGAEVTIIGGRPGNGVSAEDLGEQAGTISYEIVTSIAARVPRLYTRAGRVVEFQTLNDPFPNPWPPSPAAPIHAGR
ncbi:MAG: alanine racemase [Dehalococcoidia bacterium]|nr:alanine racemase [Dehalococcoidia bacterium]